MKLDISVFEAAAANMMTTVVETGCSEWFGHLIPTHFNYGDEASYQGNFEFTVAVDDPDGEEGRFSLRFDVTREKFEEGCQHFVDNYPRHFADILSENDDADTADVFWQCVIFKEVIYG